VASISRRPLARVEESTSTICDSSFTPIDVTQSLRRSTSQRDLTDRCRSFLRPFARARALASSSEPKQYVKVNARFRRRVDGVERVEKQGSRAIDRSIDRSIDRDRGDVDLVGRASERDVDVKGDRRGTTKQMGFYVRLFAK